jgi:myb proto-oncogene protein
MITRSSPVERENSVIADGGLALMAGHTGKWTEDEDQKLKYSVQMHGGKDWVAIATLVPGRAPSQCRSRWLAVLDPNIALMASCAGKWTEDEDLKLKHSVQTHGGKNWVAIAALVPAREQKQCHNRWCDVLAASIDKMNGPSGKMGN